MNAVIYFSNAGECKRIAEYISDKTGWTLFDIKQTANCAYNTAVVVFPVYCQNTPQRVKDFLSELQAENVALIAAYGKMSYGNVLYEIQLKYKHTVIAAAYVPTKHAYVKEERFNRFDELAVIIDKLNNPQEIIIPRSRKNPFASLAPEWRSRVGVKILRNSNCNSCGTCTSICSQIAINCGKTNNKCIRCTKCVVNCPQDALTLELSLPMRAYLSKRKYSEIVIYT